MNVYSFHIDFAEILLVCHRGCYRAAMFMGLGINAAIDPAFKSHALTKFSEIEIVPRVLSSEQLEEAKGNFRLWIESAGLREVVETFARFIDGIHWACMVIEHAGPARPDVRLVSIKKAFEKLGLGKKLDRLHRKYGIESKNLTHLLALNNARNCHAHRLGLVDQEDIDSNGHLTISWLGMDMTIRRPGQEDLVWTNEMLTPIDCPPGSSVGVTVAAREKTFALGEFMHLSTRDLAEICWFYHGEAQVICNLAQDYARSRGHIVVLPTPTS